MEFLEILVLTRTLLPFVFLLIAFICLIFWPQYRYKRLQRKIKTKIGSGVKVVTSSGTLGTVLMVLDRSIVVELFDGSRVEVLKIAIKDVLD